MALASATRARLRWAAFREAIAVGAHVLDAKLPVCAVLDGEQGVLGEELGAGGERPLRKDAKAAVRVRVDPDRVRRRRRVVDGLRHEDTGEHM